MAQRYINYKYTLAFFLLLFAFLCGFNYQRWFGATDRVIRHISLLYSYTKDETGCGNIEKLLQEEFRKQGIEAVFDRFYLNSTGFGQEDETGLIQRYFEMLRGKPVDFILAVGDQATYSLLSTRHPLLYSVPVVAFNVHFPDEKLLKEYETKKVYIFRDTPDLKRNLDFIKVLHPNTSLEIIYNVDMTVLGQKSFDLFTHVAERRNVKILGSRDAFMVEQEYEQLRKMVEYYDMMPGKMDNRLENKELIINLCPFRYIKGDSLLAILERSKREQQEQALLLDKFDRMAIPIVNALTIPSYSCIREGFGENVRIVGGYMATEEISAKAVAALATRLMKKEKVGMPKIRDLEKEYVLDWIYFSKYATDIRNVPENVRIINYSLYDRFLENIYLWVVLSVFAFILISFVLFRIYRRSLMERKNLRILEAAQKRLGLSMNGGKISLWNIHEGVIEFDEHFTHLVGLERRKFTIHAILEFVHPDDRLLLGSFYRTLYQAPGMQIQRVRFFFGGKAEDYRWFELRCSSLRDAGGKIMVAGIMQNIQELVEHEHQLLMAKQMAEKAELKQSFLNNMSHEIRTPLNAIVGFTNLLLGENAHEIDPEEKATMLGLVNTNNDLLLKLIDDVLELSRLDSGSLSFEMEVCDVTGVVKEVYATYQKMIRPSVQFCIELDDTLSLPVNIDRLRFIQVLSNFLNNANKFTGSGTITVGCQMDKEIQEVRIYVKDTGKGVDEKELMMIFDRFYKTDEFEQGSGLGLSICKVIIERMGGRIEVHSEVGKGSCFTVVLALANR